MRRRGGRLRRVDGCEWLEWVIATSGLSLPVVIRLPWRHRRGERDAPSMDLYCHMPATSSWARDRSCLEATSGPIPNPQGCIVARRHLSIMRHSLPPGHNRVHRWHLLLTAGSGARAMVPVRDNMQEHQYDDFSKRPEIRIFIVRIPLE